MIKTEKSNTKFIVITLFFILLSGCNGLSNADSDKTKNIDVAKLEELSKNYKDKPEKNLEVAFEASGEGGYYIYEKTKNNTITTSVSKKDFKIIEISKSINKLKDNTTEVFTYSADGILKKYIKSHNPTKIEGTSIGEISIERYVETIEKFNNIGSIELRKNYNELFRISLQDIITIAKENKYKDITVYRLYLDDDLSTIPALGLKKDDLVLGKPYWIIMFRESLESDNFIFRVYDGVSGSFIKEKKSKIFKN